ETSAARTTPSGSTAAPGGIKERPERLEEPRIVQQPVDLGQPRQQRPALFGQDRIPQGCLGTYGSEHDGLNPFSHKGFGPSCPHSVTDRWILAAKNPSAARDLPPGFSGASS